MPGGLGDHLAGCHPPGATAEVQAGRGAAESRACRPGRLRRRRRWTDWVEEAIEKLVADAPP
jgi:hypothetical protein